MGEGGSKKVEEDHYKLKQPLELFDEGREANDPGAAEPKRKLTDAQRMLLQADVGRKMFAPDCVYFECMHDIYAIMDTAGENIVKIWLGDGKTFLYQLPKH